MHLANVDLELHQIYWNSHNDKCLYSCKLDHLGISWLFIIFNHLSLFTQICFFLVFPAAQTCFTAQWSLTRPQWLAAVWPRLWHSSSLAVSSPGCHGKASLGHKWRKTSHLSVKWCRKTLSAHLAKPLPPLPPASCIDKMYMWLLRWCVPYHNCFIQDFFIYLEIMKFLNDSTSLTSIQKARSYFNVNKKAFS